MYPYEIILPCAAGAVPLHGRPGGAGGCGAALPGQSGHDASLAGAGALAAGQLLFCSGFVFLSAAAMAFLGGGICITTFSFAIRPFFQRVEKKR